VTGDACVDVCICTFRRDSVVDAIASLRAQVPPPGVQLRLIVADNDDTPTARDRVMRAAGPMPLVYVHAPARNISLARNACLDAATGGYVAFLDDDETAPPDWIARMWTCLQRTGADAVFGPARAVYPPDTPDWIIRNDFLSNLPQRRGQRVETGHTCNVLMRRRDSRFRVDLGRSGGEDTDFFFRMGRAGARFAICEDAEVYERADPRRLRAAWLIERRFAEGRHYGSAVVAGRGRRVAAGLGKAAFCLVRATPHLANPPGLAFWGLRAVFHAGVACGAVAGAGGRQAYG
jgi:succinoglycan biosynthesis protein ExoM